MQILPSQRRKSDSVIYLSDSDSLSSDEHQCPARKGNSSATANKTSCTGPAPTIASTSTNEVIVVADSSFEDGACTPPLKKKTKQPASVKALEDDVISLLSPAPSPVRSLESKAHLLQFDFGNYIFSSP